MLDGTRIDEPAGMVARGAIFEYFPPETVCIAPDIVPDALALVPPVQLIRVLGVGGHGGPLPREEQLVRDVSVLAVRVREMEEAANHASYAAWAVDFDARSGGVGRRRERLCVGGELWWGARNAEDVAEERDEAHSMVG